MDLTPNCRNVPGVADKNGFFFWIDLIKTGHPDNRTVFSFFYDEGLLPAQPVFIKCGVEIIIIGSIIAIISWQHFIKLPNVLIFCEKAERLTMARGQKLQADIVAS